MPKVLTVNNIPYSYPTAGDEPGWGSGATDWAEGVTDVLNDLLGPNDILETAFNIANPGTNADVTGLIFSAAAVRAAEVRYSVYRQITQPGPVIASYVETGTLQIAYDNIDGWVMNHGNILGSAGITFSITPAGQVQYSSTTLSGTSYIGTMKFRAKALLQ